MHKIITATALALTLAAVGTGASECKVGSPSAPDGTQGTVTGIEHHPANDETVLFIQLDAEHGNKASTDTMVTSGHDWDYCNVGAAWPQCLKSWK
jgi:hypothetical protein